MKQVNLISCKHNNSTRTRIHPFWIRFFVFSIFCILASLSIHIQFQAFVIEFDRQLEKSKELISKVDPQLKQFQELVAERDLLRERNRSFRSSSFQNIPDVQIQNIPITELLKRIVEALPANVWLRVIQCNYGNKTLVLEGLAKTKDDMQHFLDEGLIKNEEFYNLLINNVTLLESKQEIRFSVSLQFANTLPR